jgi:pSer/pThr/pTyr-binding forkhead associated (FHA) protein
MMANEPAKAEPSYAWLISQPGSQVQFRYLVSKDATLVGRGPDNDVVIQGLEAASVSSHHCEIHRNEAGFRIRDLESTNGTYLNGERITEAELRAPASIRFGTQGPEIAFVVSANNPSAKLDETQVIPEGIVTSGSSTAPQPATRTYDGLLSEAVERARSARAYGIANQTMTIMRDALDRALRQTGKRFRRLIVILVTGLVVVSGAAVWRIAQLVHEKQAIDRRIQDLEGRLQQSKSRTETDGLITQLDVYEDEAEQLQRNLLYRLSVHEQDFVTGEIRRMMAEFGSEVYSVPPEFTERAKYYIQQYQGPDHSLMVRALSTTARQINLIKRVLDEEHLPPGLAYVPLVESALGDDRSKAGAAGPWQFTPATAKAFGLRVDKSIDEREDVLKSTVAACHYLRELILEFGNGSSVMLALAAYDLGPAKVRQAILKTVQDPIKQRNFWYLYRARALPAETREYVPKVMAAILIGRNPQKFGF